MKSLLLLTCLLAVGLVFSSIAAVAQEGASEGPPEVESAIPQPENGSSGSGETLKRASELVLIGAAVKTVEGDDVGKVEDLLIDASTGSVEYVVLSPGGSVGPTDRLIAVPAAIFAVTGNKKMLIVAMSKNQLDNAPSFQRGNWPAAMDDQWKNDIDTYFRSHSAGEGQKEARIPGVAGKRVFARFAI